MSNRSRLFIVFFLFLPALLFQGVYCPLLGDEFEVDNIIGNLQSRFAEIEDYTVLLSVESDIKAIRVPRMEVKVFFKQPDKLHIESKAFAILPREGMLINPNRFTREDFYMTALGRETLKERETLKLELVPRKEDIRVRKLILWVDRARWIVLKVKTLTWKGQSFEVDLEYLKFNGRHWMPVKASAILDFSDFQGFSSFHGRRGWEETGRPGSEDMKGEIRVLFYDYRINEGIPDSVFDQE